MGIQSLNQPGGQAHKTQFVTWVCKVVHIWTSGSRLIKNILALLLRLTLSQFSLWQLLAQVKWGQNLIRADFLTLAPRWSDTSRCSIERVCSVGQGISHSNTCYTELSDVRSNQTEACRRAPQCISNEIDSGGSYGSDYSAETPVGKWLTWLLTSQCSLSHTKLATLCDQFKHIRTGLRQCRMLWCFGAT